MMNTFKLSIFTILLAITLPFKVNSGNLNSKQDTLEISNSEIVLVTIITPFTEVYDDGIFRKSYTGFKIYDTNNNLIKKISSSPDNPVHLKMKTGEYIIKSNANERVTYKISVSSKKHNEYIIP